MICSSNFGISFFQTNPCLGFWRLFRPFFWEKVTTEIVIYSSTSATTIDIDPQWGYEAATVLIFHCISSQNVRWPPPNLWPQNDGEDDRPWDLMLASSLSPHKCIWIPDLALMVEQNSFSFAPGCQFDDVSNSISRFPTFRPVYGGFLK